MKPKQILAVTKYNFRRWHKNPRIVITFCLAFVLCFLLSDKAVKFAKEYDTTMQLVEAFVWTFGDSNSILLSSLLLLLLFPDNKTGTSSQRRSMSHRKIPNQYLATCSGNNKNTAPARYCNLEQNHCVRFFPLCLQHGAD